MARRISRGKLLSLGFEKKGNEYVLESERGEDKVIRLDSKGKVVYQEGIPVDQDGNLLLYRRY